MIIYVFDGTLEGLLTAIFESFERKQMNVVLKTKQYHQPDAFLNPLVILNDRAKADRVWKGLQTRLGYEWIRKFYCAYLSEIQEAYQVLFNFAVYVFNNEKGVENNFGNENVLAVAKYARSVEREKHRMEAFIRFQQIEGGIYYCGIDPDFNVLPLIFKHFENRYSSQQWIIYDLKRHYGLYYDLNIVEEITLDMKERNLKPDPSQLDDKELLYANLWKDYFKSTNIESRKNTKLHVRHVPKRYWKYLTEKQPI